MSLFSPLVRKDLTELRRDRRLIAMIVGVTLLSLCAIWVQQQRVRVEEHDRAAVELRDRQTWLTQGPINPHAAAHFSSWAFRPASAMSFVDPGTFPYAGSAIWMEAHVQDFADLRPIEDRATVLDLGEFSLAWIVQVVAPLLVSMLAAGIIVREREKGTLRMLVVAGTSERRVLAAKIRTLLSLMSAIGLVLAVAAVVALLFFRAPTTDQVERIGLWLLANGLYMFVCMAVAVTISSRARTSLGATTMLMAAWAVCIFAVPRFASEVIMTQAPDAPAERFWAQIAADEKDGLDGNGGPSGISAFQKQTLAKYHVSDVKDLPVNFAGLRLNEGERVNAYIFDKRYAELRAQDFRQRRLLRAFSAISPVIALQNVSMGIAGTDNAHQWSFADQAERHRRQVVQQLNNEMTLHAGRLDFNYKAGGAMLAAVPAFQYVPPPWQELAPYWLPDAAILVTWAFVGALLLLWSLQRYERRLLE